MAHRSLRMSHSFVTLIFLLLTLSSSSTFFSLVRGEGVTTPVWNTNIVSVSQAVGVQNIPFEILSSSSPWPARYGHMLVSANSELVLMGGIGWWNASDIDHGLKDIWVSSNLGVNWKSVTSQAPFGVRQGASAVLVNQALLLVGGDTLTDASQGDVWRSTDIGRTWKQVSIESEEIFSARSYHTVAVDVPTNTLILTSGRTNLRSGVTRAYNDVWVSTDSGVTWECVNPSAAFAPRFGATSFWRNSEVYVVGGTIITTDGSMKQANDVWRSADDGKSWHLVGGSRLPSAVGPRSFHASASFASKLYLLAGTTGTDYVQSGGKDDIYGDVWMSEDEGATWLWQDAPAAFGPRGGVASVLTGGTLIVTGGVSKGNVYNDVFRANLPAGNPNADDGVVVGILGASAGLIVLVLILRAGIRYLKAQPLRRRNKALEELEVANATAALALTGQHVPLKNMDEEEGGGQEQH